MHTHSAVVHFLCVAYRYHAHALAQGPRVMKKVFCSACVSSLRLALSILMFHPPSLLTVTFLGPLLARALGHSYTSGEKFLCMADSTHWIGHESQQHRQFNPLSKESRDVIKAAGNIELCELLDVEPKAQCKVCLSYWNVDNVYCTCGHFFEYNTSCT